MEAQDARRCVVLYDPANIRDFMAVVCASAVVGAMRVRVKLLKVVYCEDVVSDKVFGVTEWAAVSTLVASLSVDAIAKYMFVLYRHCGTVSVIVVVPVCWHRIMHSLVRMRGCPRSLSSASGS